MTNEYAVDHEVGPYVCVASSARAQTYRYDGAVPVARHRERILLMGVWMAPGVAPGARGVMQYVRTPSEGRWRFRPQGGAGRPS